MTDAHAPGDHRSDIDRRLETAVESADAAGLPAVDAVLSATDDRWYGRLLLRSYESTAGSPPPEAALSAGAAVELLRAYCRLRTRLLDRGDADGARVGSLAPTASLLAGDFLYAAAYSELDGVDHVRGGACFDALVDVSETVVEALAAHYVGPTSPASELTAIDDTAGALGEGAAVVGATLAGVDGQWRDHFATLGHGLAVGREIQRTADPDAGGFHPVPDLDDRRLRRYAERRLAAADDALDELSAVDVARLRPLFEDATGDARRG
ncbi:polyprenyl synthetase [Halomicrobium salinisoli]|uniref:polyprenyl synthetase n=1 Tax=Halomicrobium salinisoli TaxID=2878391 RepID=UPI001CF07AB2|nr:polyprenyl synthetase [Halomicrobium salinisoli]